MDIADEFTPGPWLQSAANALRMPHRGRRPFTLGEAVDELGSWARDASPEAWAHGGNRKSLDRDLAESLAHVGPRVRVVVSNLLRTLDTAAPRGAVAGAAAEFTLRWAMPSTVLAAFRDLCEVASDTESTAESARERARIIASQVAAGARGSRLLSQVSALLAAGTAIDAREREGPLSPTERLIEAARILSEDPPVGEVVVWTLYRRARVPWRTSAGPITFFRADVAIPDALDDETLLFDERLELRKVLSAGAMDSEELLSGPGKDESFVLARVDLGQRSLLGAAEEATRLITALLNIVAGAGGVGWVDTRSTVTLLDGEIRASTFGRNYRERGTFNDSYGIGGSSELLDAWATKLNDAMTAGPMPTALVEALAAVREAGLIDHRDVKSYGARPVTPRVATALQDHAFEQIASLAGMKPDKLLTEIMEEEVDHLWDQRVLSALIAPIDEHPEDVDTYREREALERATTTWEGDCRVVSPAKVWEFRKRLRALVTDPATRASLESALLAISDPAEEKRTTTLARDHAQLIRERHRRVRSAIAHGNPVSVATLDSIRDFSDRISSNAVGLALEAYATGRPIPDLLSDRASARYAEMALGCTALERLANLESAAP